MLWTLQHIHSKYLGFFIIWKKITEENYKIPKYFCFAAKY